MKLRPQSRSVIQAELESRKSTTLTIVPDDNTPSQNDQDNDGNVAERNRCLRILDAYREQFRGTELEHVWCRVRNLIANGAEAPSNDVGDVDEFR